jgi:hypothetical protein
MNTKQTIDSKNNILKNSKTFFITHKTKGENYAN